ncbi:hypothetical protein KFU94_51555 [Chloroflexi bacterium TSY]|nr:hypothetical protein [Chloroflexi bacterium TSY]
MQRNIESTDVIWAGIHYLLYLRPPNQAEDSVRLSLFETEYSPHGGGNAAFLYCDPALESGTIPNGIYTGNSELAQWLFDYMYKGRDNPLALTGDNIVLARFARNGDLRRAVTVHIETAAGAIEARWSDLDLPFVHHGPGGVNTVYTYCLFVTAPTARIYVGGGEVAGEIYPREDWRRLLGRPLSSCLIGWEMWTALETE